MAQEVSSSFHFWSAGATLAEAEHADICPPERIVEPEASWMPLACREIWRLVPPRRGFEGLTPLSLGWYEFLESRRYTKQGRWIPSLLEFDRHAGEKILCLGHGLGTDWIRYARGNAEVVVCHPSQDQLGLLRHHFHTRQLSAQILQGTFHCLPLRDASMDVVCLSSLGGPIDRLEEVVREIARVLRPGGKILAIFPAAFNARRWQDWVFPWGRSRQPVDITESPRFRVRDLRRLFVDFREHAVHQRHLRRSELPHIWRWMVLPILERFMGRYLLYKAFKPLTPPPKMPAVA